MKYTNVILTLMMPLTLALPAHATKMTSTISLRRRKLEDALGPDADRFRQAGALSPSQADLDEDDETPMSTGASRVADYLQLARGGEGAPVWGPFTANFRQCAPGCVPTNYNVYRRGRHTCHAQGRAIDVGAIICGGQTHTAWRAVASRSWCRACRTRWSCCTASTAAADAPRIITITRTSASAARSRAAFALTKGRVLELRPRPYHRPNFVTGAALGGRTVRVRRPRAHRRRPLGLFATEYACAMVCGSR